MRQPVSPAARRWRELLRSSAAAGDGPPSVARTATQRSDREARQSHRDPRPNQILRRGPMNGNGREQAAGTAHDERRRTRPNDALFEVGLTDGLERRGEAPSVSKPGLDRPFYKAQSELHSANSSSTRAATGGQLTGRVRARARHVRRFVVRNANPANERQSTRRRLRRQPTWKARAAHGEQQVPRRIWHVTLRRTPAKAASRCTAMRQSGRTRPRVHLFFSPT